MCRMAGEMLQMKQRANVMQRTSAMTIHACNASQRNIIVKSRIVSQASPNFLTTTEDTSSGQKVGDTCPLYFPAPAPRKYRHCSALSATEL